jgi:hypothetical protein
MDHTNEPPLTEPLIVPALFISGMIVDAGLDVVRLVGWETTPFGNPSERRIVVRVAMTVEAARELHAGLGEVLGRLDGKGGATQ